MRFIWDCPVSDQDHFNVEDFSKHVGSLADDSISSKVLKDKLASAVYLQVSTISQALIFVTRSRGWSFTERPGLLLVAAFIIAQLVRAHAINSSWLLNFGVCIYIYINIYISLWAAIYVYRLQLYYQQRWHLICSGSGKSGGDGRLWSGCSTLWATCCWILLNSRSDTLWVGELGGCC